MIDQIELEVAAGDGGDGIVSFRREKFAPRGGPDGGDGGRGGNVILEAQRRMSTLDRYSDGGVRRADSGVKGGPNQRRGASGVALTLPVPVGTVVYDAATGEELGDLAEDGATLVVARGGRGGWGNKRFANSTRQAPKFAQRGSPGDRKRLRLDLKLLADVGLVGLPNAGKSTLLTSWSRARPKIASYPFTTLEPELGVVYVGDDAFVAADMPGLIEGASTGVGLGHEFLRHIERTRVLVHVLDMTADDPLADWRLINQELADFGHGLAEKPQILALNKIDDPDAQAHIELIEDDLKSLEYAGEPVRWFPISAATGEGTRELAQQAFWLLRQAQDAEVEAAAREIPVLTPTPQRTGRYETYLDDEGMAVVDGPTPNWLALTLDLHDRAPREEFFGRLKRMGVHRALRRLGVSDGDMVRVGEVELRWEE
ncbi:MAG: GTPase ObgE [Dehalococcoidia bacterium]|nr:GTPase ObgE [Dehalococcoidia bacterium]